jgi:hypothetical protein
MMPAAANQAGQASEAAADRIAPQYTILGVRLLPLSAGRFQILRALDSPFASDEPKDATLEDLFIAVAVCGMPCAEFKERLIKGTFKKPFRKWGKRLCKQIRREKYFTSHSRINMVSNYVRQSLKLPFVPLPVQNEVDWGTSRHWIDCLSAVLRARLGWSKEDVDEVPIGEALQDYWGLMEAEGHARLVPLECYREMEEIGKSNMEVLLRMQKEKEAQDGAES